VARGAGFDCFVSRTLNNSVRDPDVRERVLRAASRLITRQCRGAQPDQPLHHTSGCCCGYPREYFSELIRAWTARRARLAPAGSCSMQ